MNNPQLTPFKFPNELEDLYKFFFLSGNHEHKKIAIGKVRSYLTKGSIPHSIEMTALLTEAILHDEIKTGIKLFKYEKNFPIIHSNNQNGSDLSIRMQYSMSIIKFVNGLLDPFQQSLYNISLHKLAIELNLPNYFVESRHASTHERLPSLQMLRLITQRALNWLKIQYWEEALSQYKSRNLLTISDKDWKYSIENAKKKLEIRNKKEKEREREKENNSIRIGFDREKLKKLDALMKSIKKLRKREIETNKKETKIFNDLMKSISTTFINTTPTDLFIDALIFKNYFILHGEKILNLNEKQINGLRILWGPIIKFFDKSFISLLWERIFTLVSKQTLVEYDSIYVEQNILNQKRIDYFQNECEILQATEWICWILENVEFVNKDNIKDIINLFLVDSEISRRSLPIFKAKYNELIKECKLDKKISTIETLMSNFWVDNNNIKKRKLEEIDPDNNIVSNSYIQNKKKQRPVVLFEKHESWRPVPFGCPP
jgi:ribosomal biogenesis protein LAS1